MIGFFSKIYSDEFDVPKPTVDGGSFQHILQVVFALAAAVALIVLLIASLKYVVSRGDPTAVAKAKNTILYAVIGLVVAASAFSIVSFVVKAL